VIVGNGTSSSLGNEMVGRSFFWRYHVYLRVCVLRKALGDE